MEIRGLIGGGTKDAISDRRPIRGADDDNAPVAPVEKVSPLICILGALPCDSTMFSRLSYREPTRQTSALNRLALLRLEATFDAGRGRSRPFSAAAVQANLTRPNRRNNSILQSATRSVSHAVDLASLDGRKLNLHSQSRLGLGAQLRMV